MRYDYRTKYKSMSIDDLVKHMQHNKKQYDKYFVLNSDDLANKHYKIYTYLKSKIEALTKDKTPCYT